VNHIISKYKDLSFDEFLASVCRQIDETVYLSDEAGFNENEAKTNSKNEVRSLESNDLLREKFIQLRTPFDDEQLMLKEQYLVNAFSSLFDGLTSDMQTFNQIIMTWDGVHPRVGLSFHYEKTLKHKIEYAEYGELKQTATIDIKLSEFFGQYFEFEKVDERFLLIESDELMDIYQGLKLQFHQLLFKAISQSEFILSIQKINFYACEFDTDCTLIFSNP